jgi:hypothetical protein
VFNRKATSDYYTLKTQRELIVEHPTSGDQVADAFYDHWKVPPKPTFAVPATHRSRVSLHTISHSPSQTIAYKKSEKIIPERIPDSEHLAQM